MRMFAMITSSLDGEPVEAYLEQVEQPVRAYASESMQNVFNVENVRKLYDAIGSPSSYWSYEIGEYAGEDKERFDKFVAKLPSDE